ncbi:MAG TPA: M48 family metallopeptidase [Tenericutes bacterium]|nr:M48 family metallopeptidase [Mycoplasmatota bacterium]
MNYEIDGKKYNVEIIRKNNKNTYIRIKNDFTIQITTNFFVSKKNIYELITLNILSIKKMIENKRKTDLDSEKFYYLGRYYDIIILPNQRKMVFDDNRIIVSDEKKLDKWLNKNINSLFNERVEHIYNLMDEEFEFPKIKIRKMKTRWGVCNRSNNTITLNSNLIRYSIDKIDYVIIHELCHFTHFNHSKDFWKLVEKYCPEYKKIRRDLKD